LSVRQAIRLLVGTLSRNLVLLTSSTAWAIASCKKCNIAKSAAPNRSGSFTRRAAELVQRPGRSGPRLMSQAEQLPLRPRSSKSMHLIRQFIAGWVASPQTFKVTSRSATRPRMRPVQIFRVSNIPVVSQAIQSICCRKPKRRSFPVLAHKRVFAGAPHVTAGATTAP
jgi:hypothetical protein